MSQCASVCVVVFVYIFFSCCCCYFFLIFSLVEHILRIHTQHTYIIQLWLSLIFSFSFRLVLLFFHFSLSLSFNYTHLPESNSNWCVYVGAYCVQCIALIKCVCVYNVYVLLPCLAVFFYSFLFWFVHFLYFIILLMFVCVYQESQCIRTLILITHIS